MRFIGSKLAAGTGETPPHIDTVTASASVPGSDKPTDSVSGILPSQYARDLKALDAAGGDGGCFFTAMGEIIRARTHQ